MSPSSIPMPRTAAGLRTDDGFSGEPIDPEWRPWIALVELAVAESQQPAWADCVSVRSDRLAEVPLLHGATLRIPRSAATPFVDRLVRQLGILATEAADPNALVRAGVERDIRFIEVLAHDLAVPVDTCALVGQVAALPLLLNAARKLDPETSRNWQRGYCPVCGAWPSMVEMRGIQREHRLRCGCCGADWLLPVLRCAFCDETDYRKLGFLSSDAGDQLMRVETCSTCHGYLKAVTTLGALPFVQLGKKDLATVAFDLEATDRGFSRPSRPGWMLSVEFAA